MEKERFTQIKDYPGYLIDTNGVVISLWTGTNKAKIGDCFKILKQSSIRGYKHLTLCKNGKHKSYRVHRLVLETFIGKCPLGFTASHLDGMRSNNKLENLIWEKHNINNARKKDHHTWQSGEKAANVKLNLPKVNLIRLLNRKFHYKAPILAKWFKVSKGNINFILSNKTWIN